MIQEAIWGGMGNLWVWWVAYIQSCETKILISHYIANQ